MKQYFLTIIYISAFCIILELILPENKLKKYINVLVSLIIVLVICSPLVDTLKSDKVVETLSSAVKNITINVKVPETYDFSEYKNRMILSNVKNRLEEELLNGLKNKFSENNISKVDIKLNESYEIVSVNVHIEHIKDVFKAKEIIAFLQDTYNIDGIIINLLEED